ncbi:MAG: DEAD/DEAH box helicase [Microbacterium chocolatum]|nr:DEAD/DEAH box helicase [Microbacterium chocolatum]
MNFWESVAHSVAREHVGRGRALLARGWVTLLDIDANEDTAAIDAVVRDVATRGGDEVMAVSFSVDTSSGMFESYCSCGEAPECSHIAAVLLCAGAPDAANAATPASPLSGPPATPDWVRALEGVLPPRQTAAGEHTELCLFISLDDGAPQRWQRTQRPPSLRVRPGVRGARGAWIKGSAQWGRLAYLAADPDAVELLEELGSLSGEPGDGWGYRYSHDEWVSLDRLPSRTLWSLFDDLRASGVAIVSPGKQQHPVRFDGEPVTAQITVVERDGRLSVGGGLVTDDGARWPHETPLLLIGSPAIAVAQMSSAGTADERVILHRLTAPAGRAVTEMIRQPEALSIGRDERDRFERDYLPRLQMLAPVASPDGSYDVPRPPQTTLELHVEHAERQAHLTWTWNRVPSRPDPAREAAIIDAVRAAAGIRSGIVMRDAADDQRPPDQILRGTDAVLFVAETLPALREVDGLRVSENSEPESYRAASGTPDVAVSAESGDNDWFDLNVRVSVDGEEIDFATLFTALSVGDPVLVLPSGTYFSLDTPELRRLHDLIAEASALSDRPVERPAVSRYQADLWEELVELGVVARQEVEWWMKVRSLTDQDRLEQAAVPATLRATLRDYQHAGYSWMHFLRTHSLGGILADDMGLGKTLQTITMLERARVDGEITAPFLIVAPTSVVGNWATESARFAPDLAVTTLTATESRRGTTLGDAIAGAHVVVTSYALFRLEFDHYQALPWSGLVLDEAQQIKNPASRGYKCARLLDAPFTLVVTGTPLENNLLELWALVSLACPGLLGGRRSFTEHYRTPIEREQDADRLQTLQRRLRPFLLRRTKELVAAELPPKQEQDLVLTLHPTHQRLYDRRLTRERQRVLSLVEDVDANRFEIFRSLTLLRQLALAPDLVDEGDAPSAKLDALVDLLKEAASEGHRALVLSQFTRFLTRARDAAAAAGLTSQYLDGSTTNRAAVIDRFRTGDDPAFFVSLKAGGVGLNLVEADYVFLLDPWWNPAVEAQAIDRTHRIGQTRPVIVYRMVAKGTVEEKVMALKTTKSQLFARVLDSGAGATPEALTADDIRGLVE